MNYSEPLYLQFFVFLKALACGIVIGVFYDLLGVLFGIMPQKRFTVIIKDLLFCFFSSVFSFFFMVLYNNGVVRLNLVIAQVLGAVVFHKCLGKYIFTPMLNFALAIKKLIMLLLTPIFCFYKRLVQLKSKAVSKIKIKAESIKIKRNEDKKEKQKKRQAKKIQKENSKKKGMNKEKVENL